MESNTCHQNIYLYLFCPFSDFPSFGHDDVAPMFHRLSLWNRVPTTFPRIGYFALKPTGKQVQTRFNVSNLP
jgi:hypothetical protein